MNASATLDSKVSTMLLRVRIIERAVFDRECWEFMSDDGDRHVPAHLIFHESDDGVSVRFEAVLSFASHNLTLAHRGDVLYTVQYTYLPATDVALTLSFNAP